MLGHTLSMLDIDSCINLKLNQEMMGSDFSDK